MAKQEYKKSDIAKQQLETAIGLFLNEVDYASAITLAGAADNILHQLVLNEGKQPFLDYARDIHNVLNGFTPKRGSYKHHIDKKMGIANLKHMGPNCSAVIEIDLLQNAANAIKKAIANYTTLYGDKEPMVVGFLKWCWVNEDGEAIMKAYNSLPKGVK
ncbi:MAG: hypothetical protein JKY34_03005 [Kordiimonadaceae bacterium]|nr:hypothetical protein [Kordiimonadaceae bacterium]